MKPLWRRVVALADDNTFVAGTLIAVVVAIVAMTSFLWVPALHVRNWWHNKRKATPKNTPGGAG